MIHYMRNLFRPSKPPTMEEHITHARLEAAEPVAGKDRFTTIPVVEDLASRISVHSRQTELELRGRSVPASLRDQLSDWPLVRMIWAVPTARGGTVHMSVDRTPHHNDERYVVIVEARAFYALWLTTRDKNWGHAGIPANEGDFPNDRKCGLLPEKWSSLK